jgi:hypothetical protein
VRKSIISAVARDNIVSDHDRLASVVAIEVDGRQAYLLETDKWREMLGASQIIDSTVSEAQQRFREEDGLFLFGPVSGEIRAWSFHANRARLLQEAWALRRFLAQRGVEHTCAYMECSVKHFLTEKTDDDVASEEAILRSRQSNDNGRLPEPVFPHLAWVHGELSQRINARKTAKDEPASELSSGTSLDALDMQRRIACGVMNVKLARRSS